MALLDQIKNSTLSKQGQTNPSGIWEGTPSNVGVVIRGQATPSPTSLISPNQNPVDIVYGAKPQPTYLEYLKTANKL